MNSKSLALSWGLFYVALIGLPIPATSSTQESSAFEHKLVVGETFEYERIFRYELNGSRAKVSARITLDVVRAEQSGATVHQTIAVAGGKTTRREIVVGRDGRWIYPDENIVAQDFVGYDVTQFGELPPDAHVGSMWEVDVPTTAMFHSGRAVIKLLALSGGIATLESVGHSEPSQTTVMDNDTHKVVPVSTSVNWRMTTVLNDGILVSFERTDIQHIRLANSFNDQHEYGASLKLISHKQP